MATNLTNLTREGSLSTESGSQWTGENEPDQPNTFPQTSQPTTSQGREGRQERGRKRRGRERADCFFNGVSPLGNRRSVRCFLLTEILST